MGTLLSLVLAAAATAAAEPRIVDGNFTTSDGVRLHYLEAGSGPAIVFVPGWTVPAWMWEPQLRHFQAGHRVVALDPRSQGLSQQVTEGLYPERRAEDVKELIEHLRLAPAVVVGHSLAVTELLSYVERFGTSTLAGLVLVDQGFGPYPPPDEADRFYAFVRAFARNRGEFHQRAMATFFRKPPPPGFERRLREDVMKVPTATAVALLATRLGMDLRPVLSKIDKPLLYAITPAFQREAELVRSSVPGARVEVFESSAHVLFMDEPDRFERALAELAARAFARPH